MPEMTPAIVDPPCAKLGSSADEARSPPTTSLTTKTNALMTPPAEGGLNHDLSVSSSG